VPYHRVSDAGRLQALLAAVLLIESDLDLVSLLRQIVGSAVELVGARYGALGVLDLSGQGLSEFVHVGLEPAAVEAIGHLPEGRGILGLVIADPRPVRLAALADRPESVGFPVGHPSMSSFLGVPIRVRGQVFGNLYLTEKMGAAEFSEEDEQLVSALASAAGIAVENARLHARVRDLTLAEDRERIARDLHDTVIQRVFAVALSLQTAQRLSTDPVVAKRLENAVTDLDETIRQIRTAVFALEPPPTASGGLRVRILELLAGVARGLGFDPEIRFDGLIDLVPRPVGTELLAALQEALANVTRHAAATRVEITLQVTDAQLRLRVLDNGVGPAEGDQAGRGLGNMTKRARALGGSFAFSGRPEGGSRVDWDVPLG
jgi:signal transduction histidine kinase